jgi:hypothetical protein
MLTMASPNLDGFSATLFTQQGNNASWLGIAAAKHLGRSRERMKMRRMTEISDIPEPLGRPEQGSVARSIIY